MADRLKAQRQTRVTFQLSNTCPWADRELNVISHRETLRIFPLTEDKQSLWACMVGPRTLIWDNRKYRRYGMVVGLSEVNKWLAGLVDNLEHGSKHVIAREIGVAPDQFSRILNGSRRVSADELIKAILYFRAVPPQLNSIQDLISGTIDTDLLTICIEGTKRGLSDALIPADTTTIASIASVVYEHVAQQEKHIASQISISNLIDFEVKQRHNRKRQN